jgi:hypothetical protein
VTALINGKSIDATVNFRFENPGRGAALRALDWYAACEHRSPRLRRAHSVGV